MKNIDEFLHHLVNYQPQKNGTYKAPCPVHGDGPKKSDWHVSLGQKGDKIWLKCFKGCSNEAILKAWGMGIPDLYLDQEEKAAGPRRLPDPYSLEAPELLQHHVDHLKDSAISLDIILERGYKSLDASDPLMARLGFSRTQQSLGIGILIPLYGVDGDIVGYQFRPDHPREDINEEGKARKRKYEMPPKSKNRLDVLPRCLSYLGDPQIPLYFLEGTKKSEAILTAAEKAGVKICAVMMTGVWNFKGTNSAGGKTLSPDFEYIAFNERQVYIAFDSDADSNPSVALARKVLTGISLNKKALVKHIHLPEGADGQKTGADDYFAQGHTFSDFMSLAAEPEKKSRQVLKNPYEKADGILWYSDGSNYLPLGNFSAAISAVIENDDGLNVTKYFKIVGEDYFHEKLPEVIVPAVEFDSMNWVTEHWDVRATISAERSAKARMAEALKREAYNNLFKALRLHVFNHTGWRTIQGKRTFLTAGGAIGMPDIQVDLARDELTHYCLPQPETDPRKIKAALIAGYDFLKIGNPDVLMPLWSAMFMCPLNEIFVTDFTLFIDGLSGQFKSGAAALAMNFYGPRFNYNDFPANWNFSDNRLEKMMSTLKDIPSVIDDLAPGATEAKKKQLEEKAERVIRAQANRGGRGRLMSDTSSRQTYLPRGFLVVTGESEVGGQSAKARMFIVEIFKGDIDRVKFFSALEQKQLYSQVMTQYILWVDKHWDQLAVDLPRQIPRWTTQALEIDKEQHARLPAAVAKLYAGLITALSFYRDMGIISETEAEAKRKEGWDIFMKWSQEQSRKVDQERPGKAFMKAIITLRDQGRVVFWSTEDEKPLKAVPGETMIGWQDLKDGSYYLNPGAAFAAARDFCERIGKPLTMDEEAVWRDLLQMGYSEGEEKKRGDKSYIWPKCQKWIYEGKITTVKLKRDCFDA